MFGDGEGDEGQADALYESSFYTYETAGQRQAFQSESLAILRQQGDPRRLVACMLRQADFLSDQEDFEGARALLEEVEQIVRTTTLAVLQQQGDQGMLVDILLTENSILVHLGLFARAEARGQELLALSSEDSQTLTAAQVRAIAGFPALYLGRYSQVRKEVQQTLALARQEGHEVAASWALMHWAWAALAEEAFEEAETRLQEPLAIFQTISSRPIGPPNLGQVLATLGIALRGMGRPARAWPPLNEALRIAVEEMVDHRHRNLPLVKALPGIALLLADEGQTERAVELYALARTHPMVANGQWFEDIAGRHIAAAAATLPPAVAAAAAARGRAGDMWATAVKLLAELDSQDWGAAVDSPHTSPYDAGHDKHTAIE